MMNKKVMIMLAAGFFLAACSEKGAVDVPGKENAEISMKSIVNNVNSNTRTPYVGISPDSDNPLKSRVFASLNADNYTTPYTDGTITFSNSQPAMYDSGVKGLTVYPGNAILYFQGVYPADKWTLESGKTSRTFQGIEDIMLTKVVASNGESTPVLEFSHLLTKLEIKVKAVDEEAENSWSEVQQIELIKVGTSEPYSNVAVELGKTTPVFQNPISSFRCFVMEEKEAEESGQKSIAYYSNEYNGKQYKPTTTSVYQAYTLAAPVQASDLVGAMEYTFRVTALNSKGIQRVMDVPVDLKNENGNSFIDSTEGYSFTVTFSFYSKTINATATVNEWKQGGNSETPVG